jgi:hypothetical protein
MFHLTPRNPKPPHHPGILKKAVLYLLRALPERYLAKMNVFIQNDISPRLDVLTAEASHQSRRTPADLIHQRMQDNMSEILD